MTVLLCALGYAVASLAPFAAQANEDATIAGEIVSVSGVVFVRPDNSAKKTSLRPAKPGEYVRAGDVINTSSKGAIKLLLKDKSVVDLGASTLFKVKGFEGAGGADRKVDLQVTFGTVRAAITQKIKGSGAFRIRTPSATMGVRGTITYGQVSPGNSMRAAGNTTFLITQGQGVVTGNSTSAPPVVLNPGDQVISAGGASPLNRQTLTQTQFSQRQNEVNSLARSSDTAFALATNFDRATQHQQEQQQATQATNQANQANQTAGSEDDKDKDKKEKGDHNGDGHADNGKGPEGDTTADSGESAPAEDRAPAAAGESSTTETADSGPAGGVLESVATTIETIAPPVPEVSVTNMDIAGAPSAESILTDQSSTSATPAITSGKLQINVRWQ